MKTALKGHSLLELLVTLFPCSAFQSLRINTAILSKRRVNKLERSQCSQQPSGLSTTMPGVGVGPGPEGKHRWCQPWGRAHPPAWPSLEKHLLADLGIPGASHQLRGLRGAQCRIKGEGSKQFCPRGRCPEGLASSPVSLTCPSLSSRPTYTESVSFLLPQPALWPPAPAAVVTPASYQPSPHQPSPWMPGPYSKGF